MKKISKGLIVALSLVPAVGFSQKVVNIDVKSNVHSISPYIYGTNESYDGATAARWGGNRSSSYNWENNASNGGNDANFTSDNFYDYTASTTPGLPILNAVKTADSKGQYSLVSLQAAGYVAADKNGVVMENQIAPSERWIPVSFHKEAPYSLTPDLNDGVVYVDELINYMSVNLGRAGDGGISAYAIDNEPYLWNQTHARLHPEKTTPEELIEKTADLSSVIRELAPGADIFGPMFFGWTDAYQWGLSGSDWMNIYNLSRRDGYPAKYSWFVDYYLDTLCRIEKSTGIRPVDAIAFHWYPETQGPKTKKRIVNMDNDVSASELIAEDMIEARLQAPRALWDSKYNDGSYVSIQGGKAIISKIKKSIDLFYPGTKIAFTEFEYDAEDHWSGGLTLVDVLGIFGREDVYLACKWDTFKKYSIAAYNLYLNYDGNNSKFGTTSVYAMQNDTAALSSFASLDDEGNLHIISVNKTGLKQNTVFNIANGIYTDGVVYGFGQNSANISQYDVIDKIENSSFSYVLPAYSATHIILNVASQSKIVKANVVDPNVDEINVYFADDIQLVSEKDARDEFSVLVEGATKDVSAVSVEGSLVKVKLTTPVLATDKQIKITYNGSNLIGSSNLPVASFDTVLVYNEQNDAPIHVLSAQVDQLGRYVILSMSKEIGEVKDFGGLKMEKNSSEVAVKSLNVSTDSPYDLYVYPAERIIKYDDNLISGIASSDLLAKDGSQIHDFSMKMEGGANYAPKIDSMIVKDNYTIKLYFSTNMNPDLDYDNVGLNLSCSEGDIKYTSKYTKNNRILTMTTETPMMPGVEYTLSYIDNSLVTTIHNGVLESFSKVLDNQLEDMGAKLVNVPSEVIQCDQFWSRVGNPVIEDCSDTSSLGNGKHLGYIGLFDSYSYKINVEEDRNYTVYVRYASTSDGEINFDIDGELYHLTLPSSGSFMNWVEAYRVIPLTTGEHEIKVMILKSGFNMNYIQFKAEEKSPVSKITKTNIPAKGDVVRMYFATNIATLPLVDELSLSCNDTVSIPIVSVDYNSSAVLNINIDTTIYKGDNIVLQLHSETIKTVDGGEVKDTVVVVSNKSTQIYVPPVIDAIEEIGNDFVVAPIPVNQGENTYISTSKDCEISYMIISSEGKVVESGNFVGYTSFALTQTGIYTIILNDGNSITTKKIVVR